MPFAGLEAAQLGRCLAQVAQDEADHVDLYLEEVERVEVPDGVEGPGLLACREAGLAVRLLREGRTWLASRDQVCSESLRNALRQVARAVPSAGYLPGLTHSDAWLSPVDAPELVEFPRMLRECIKRRNVAFPTRIQLTRHRRRSQVVGTRLVSDMVGESFYSLVVEMPWGSHGALLAELGDEQAAAAEETLLSWFRARSARAPEAGRSAVVLGPAATAVFLHEAVAHALEADTLALEGPAEAACGVRLAADMIDVLDDPTSAPPGVRRAFDDEGMPAIRRWLIKSGEVREPLADLVHAKSSLLLSPGAARRGSRHLAPAPRSFHLELLPGTESREALLTAADGGLFFADASRGSLDPLSGEVEIQFPFGWRIDGSGLGDMVGPSRLRGRVAELLSAVEAVGEDRRFNGAGWCGKSGHRLAVWATCPAVRLANVEVEG